MKLLVAIDLSESSAAVVDAARSLAAATGAALTLLHVAAPEPYFVGYDVDPPVMRDALAARFHREHRELQAMGQSLRDEGFACTPVLAQGATVETILREAEHTAADMVVIGSHGKGVVKRLVRPSDRVVYRAWSGYWFGEPEMRLLPALCDPTRVAVDVGGGDEVQRPGLGDRLPLLEGDQVRELVVGPPERLEEVREVLLALLRAAGPPVEEGLPRGRHRRVDLLRAGPLDLGELPARRRVPRVEGLPRRDVETVDDRARRQGEPPLQIIAPRVIFSTCLR